MDMQFFITFTRCLSSLFFKCHFGKQYNRISAAFLTYAKKDLERSPGMAVTLGEEHVLEKKRKAKYIPVALCFFIIFI